MVSKGKIQFVLVLAGIFLGLFSLEIVCRIFLKSSSFTVHRFAKEFQYDPVLGWKGIPFAQITEDIASQPCCFNSDGFRDEEWSGKLQRSTNSQSLKILLLGDSQVYGKAESRQGRLDNELARYLSLKIHKHIEIFNAGIPGFALLQELSLGRQIIPRIKPDIVILQFNENDPGEDSLPYEHRYPERVYKPWISSDGLSSLYIHGVPLRPSLALRGTILGSFRILRAFDRISEMFDTYIKYPPLNISENRRVNPPFLTMDNLFTSPQYSDLLNKEYPRIPLMIKNIASLTIETGARFLVVLPFSLPPENNFLPVQQKLIEELDKVHIASQCFSEARLSYPFDTYTPTSGRIFVGPGCNQEHFSASYQLPSNSLRIPFDGHRNRLGNTLLAEAIANSLIDQQQPLALEHVSWLSEVPHELNLTDSDHLKFIFGQWDPISKTKGLQLRNSGGFILSCGTQAQLASCVDITLLEKPSERPELVQYLNNLTPKQLGVRTVQKGGAIHLVANIESSSRPVIVGIVVKDTNVPLSIENIACSESCE